MTCSAKLIAPSNVVALLIAVIRSVLFRYNKLCLLFVLDNHRLSTVLFRELFVSYLCVDRFTKNQTRFPKA